MGWRACLTAIGCLRSEYLRQMSSSDFDWLLNFCVSFNDTFPRRSPSDPSSYSP
jgi:hypothetical protein